MSVIDTLSPMIPALTGGACIGLAALWGARLHGRVTGVSGELYRAVVGDGGGVTPADRTGGRSGALCFLGGLGLAGAVFSSGVVPFVADGGVLLRGAGVVVSTLSLSRLLFGGFLVGAGAGVSNGCTSGHGVCGLSRMSGRSFVAVGTFMTSGVITASLTNAASAIPPQDPTLTASAAGVGLTVTLAAAPYALAVATKAEPLVHAARGLLFGAGLVLSGMAHPGNTVRFLDVATPGWTPALAAVFLGALPVAFAGFKTKQPLLAKSTAFPTRADIDPPLVAGAAAFGAGWAITGMCPAPAITLLGAAPTSSNTLATIAAVTAGLVAGKRAQAAWNAAQEQRRRSTNEEQEEEQAEEADEARSKGKAMGNTQR